MFDKCLPKIIKIMATTFTYVVRKNHVKKDGTVAPRIRMTHNRVQRFVETNIYLTKDQLTRSFKIKDQNVIDMLEGHVRKYREAISHIDGAAYMDADTVWELVQDRVRNGDGFRLDVFEYAEAKIAKMEGGTATSYRTSFNALRRFVRRDSLDINEITYKFLVSFREFIENEPVQNLRVASRTKIGGRSVSCYLSCLRHIYNLAREEFNDEDMGLIRIPRQPFKKNLIPQPPITEHRCLTTEQMRSFICHDYRGDNRQARVAWNVFLMSFYLVGMNSVDLYHLKKSNVKDGIMTYNRRKTDSRRKDNAKIAIRIEPEARRIMDMYKELDKDSDYYFIFHNMFSNHKNFNKSLNIGLKAIAKRIVGLPENLQYYHARHTWATLARNECRIDFDTVHEALNHARSSDGKVTDIYVAKDFSRIWEANRKVLDLLSD